MKFFYAYKKTGKNISNVYLIPLDKIALPFSGVMFLFAEDINGCLCFFYKST